MTQILPIALKYLSQGYSVIPVGLDKRPLIQWKDFQTRRATIDELVSWWTQNPDAQIGIVTGQISNLTVVDLESDADFELIKDPTYAVKTGGGGKHLYFQYEEGFKNAVRILPSVDIRSEGGYIIASGSTSHKGSYEALNDLPVIKMSSETREALKKANKPQLPWYANSGETSYPKTTTDELNYSGSAKGGRNDSMTKFAGLICAKLHRSLWATIGWQLFESANLKNNPPLSPYELRVIWNSIGSIETRNNPGGRDYLNNDYSSKEKTWGPEPEKKETKHQFEDSMSDEPEVDSKETLHASDVAAAQTIDSDHTYPINMQPFDEALLGGFSAGEVIIVAGQSGVGKTTIMQDWSVTLSSGGGDVAREKLPSLWFSYEVLAKPLWNKFQTMGADLDTPIYMPRFNETGDIAWVTDVVERAIEKWGIKIVCIDHLGFLRPPKGNYSNAADAITNTVRALKKLAVKRGLIILLPVHVRKTSSKTPDLNDIRDSLGIAQEADTVFFIGREKDNTGLSTQQAKLWLVKNRKTGISVSATLDFAFGRYYYNSNENSQPTNQDND